MSMDQAAVFLAGSILTMLGFIVVIAGILAINNLLHKYWKPVSLLKWQDHYHPQRFASEEELARIAPQLKEDDDAGRSNQGQGKS